MAAPFQVNISVAAGTDFTQEYSVVNPDNSPVNITGYKFFAKLAKHPTAIDAVVSTSGSPSYKYVTFTTLVVDGKKGVYSITLPASETSKLQEGKYVYNVIMQDLNGDKSSVVSGIAFVEVAFGAAADNVTPPSSSMSTSSASSTAAAAY